MRKDFDYVEFPDYKHDMDELGAGASNTIAKLVRDKEELTYKLWLVVHAAGGRVTIRDSDLARHSPNDCQLRLSRFEEDAAFVIEAVVKRQGDRTSDSPDPTLA